MVSICIKSYNNIFTPIKKRIKAIPYFKYANKSASPDSAKYRVRNPITAKIFDVITTKGL
jgi:hypothetical protein